MKKNSFVFFTFNKQMEICNTQGKHIKFDLIRRKLCDCCLLCHMMFRSNHQRCSVEIDVLKNSAKFTGKHQCQSLFFNKVAGLRLVNVWTNFTTHFSLLHLIFIKVWPKKDLRPLYGFRQISLTNACYCTPPTVRSRRIAFFSTDKLRWLFQILLPPTKPMIVRTIHRQSIFFSCELK